MITGGRGTYDAAERLRGYREAMREAGVEVPNEWELAGDFSEASGHRAVARCWRSSRVRRRSSRRTTPWRSAQSSALREAGLRVPEDMAVAGFDDIPIARYTSPPLTSVHVSIAELGGRAVETLLHAMVNKGAHTRRHQRLATTLVVRQSCGSGSGARATTATVAYSYRAGARARTMQNSLRCRPAPTRCLTSRVRPAQATPCCPGASATTTRRGSHDQWCEVHVTPALTKPRHWACVRRRSRSCCPYTAIAPPQRPDHHRQYSAATSAAPTTLPFPTRRLRRAIRQREENRGTVSNSSGFYTLAGLRPGDYELTVRRIGFSRRRGT